jgi:RNA-directed DNA polymerase
MSCDYKVITLFSIMQIKIEGKQMSANDIIIHTRREQIAQSILNKLHKRFTECGLTIHPTKTQIVCLTRNALHKDVTKVHGFEMGGFVFTRRWN